jgi:hypothetical protein
LEEPRIFLAKPSMGDPVKAVERLKALKQEASWSRARIDAGPGRPEIRGARRGRADDRKPLDLGAVGT